MIICARPQTEFLKHEFFRTPSFHKWKHFRIYILGLIGTKPKKMAFTSTIHFFVLFPLAMDMETVNTIFQLCIPGIVFESYIHLIITDTFFLYGNTQGISHFFDMALG